MTDLLQEWDHEANAPLTPDTVSAYSHLRVWWKCGRCTRRWQTTVASRVRGSGCSRCSQKQAYSVETIRVAARLYDRVGDFRKYDNGCYAAAGRKGILKSVCEHMVPTKFDTSLSNRAALLAVPNGSPRPGRDTFLGKALQSLCSRDKAFASLIKKHQPDWFSNDGLRSRMRIAQAKVKGGAVVDQNGITYGSISSAARTLGLDRKSIACVARGERKSTRGHTFRYATEEEIRAREEQVEKDVDKIPEKK